MAKPLFRIKMEVKGLKEVLANLSKAERDIQEAARESLDRDDEWIFNRSQQIVPVKTGILAASGEKEEAKFTFGRRGIVAVIRYTRDYAFEQHEVPYAHAHGQWKYLQTPVEERSDDIIRNMAIAVRQEL